MMVDRYYLVHDHHMPTLEKGYGEHHSISLGSHGSAGASYHIVALCNHVAKPPKEWIQFPSVLDPRTPIKSVLDHTKLADLGLTGDEPTYEALNILGKVHPRMSI